MHRRGNLQKAQSTDAYPNCNEEEINKILNRDVQCHRKSLHFLLVRQRNYIINLKTQRKNIPAIYPAVNHLLRITAGEHDSHSTRIKLLELFITPPEKNTVVILYKEGLYTLNRNKQRSPEISDLEKDIYNEKEYDDRETDNTINYYALYILSQCDGFLSSSMCNGVFIVGVFNEGRFECDDSVRELILKGQAAEAE